MELMEPTLFLLFDFIQFNFLLKSTSHYTANSYKNVWILVSTIFSIYIESEKKEQHECVGKRAVDRQSCI